MSATSYITDLHDDFVSNPKVDRQFERVDEPKLCADPGRSQIAEYFLASSKKSFAGVRHRTSKSVRLVTVVN